MTRIPVKVASLADWLRRYPTRYAMARWTVVVLLTALATACSKRVDAERSSEGNRTPRELELIRINEDTIRNRLRDPSGAEFRGSRVYYGYGTNVCGEVNATNAYGGKVGFQRFIAGGSIVQLEREDVGLPMDTLWHYICTDVPSPK